MSKKNRSKHYLFEEDVQQDIVTPKVLEDIHKRSILGINKYGKPLTTNDGRDPLQDLYEELLDAVQYLKKYMMERGIE